MKILLGEISSYKAIVVASYIRRHYTNVEIYSFDKRSFTKNVKTKYVHKHFVVANYSIQVFKELIETHTIDFFIPVINENLANFWNNKEHFGTALSYLGDFSAYTVLNDKSLVHALAIKNNVQVPKKYNNISNAEVPFIVKPTNLSSSKGVIYIKEEHQRPTGIDLNNMLVQQYVKGEGVGYSFYCKNGIIVDGYGHIRLAEFPVSGGSSTYRKRYDNKRMHIAASKIVKELNYTGFAMFEFKLTADNELYLLEVNPRIWGSVNQGLTNGVNYFDKIFNVSYKATKTNSRNTYLGPLVYISLFSYLIKGRPKPMIQFMKNMLNNSADIHILKDPGGYFSTILRKLV